MGALGKTLVAAGLVAGIGGGIKGCTDYNEYIAIDKNIVTPVSLAGATVTAGANSGNQSMESLLDAARKESKSRNGTNSALFYNIDFFEMNNLTALLTTATQHAKELGMLDEAYKTNTLSPDAPQWVRLTYENCVPSHETNMNLRRLLSSEFSGVIGVVYEGFNDAVSGGTVVSGEKVSSSNMALVDILKSAAGKSWWPTSHANFTDMNNAAAHAYFALIYANMGKLQEAQTELGKTHDILGKYSDNADLGVVISGYKNLNVGFLRGTVEDAMNEFKELDGKGPDQKYTRGWWGQVQKKAESLGSKEIFIGDIADQQSGRYGLASALWWATALIGGGLLGLAGFAKWDDFGSGSWQRPRRGRF